MSDREMAPRPRVAAMVALAGFGLAGLVWMIWPRPPIAEHGEVSAAGSGWTKSADKVVLSGPTMGTSFTVVVSDALEGDAIERLRADIDAELEAVNAEMSTYRPDSELSRFNRAGAGAMAASDPLIEVVAAAKQVSAASDGAFDVTVGPLVDAWGFGPGDPTQRHELSDAEITAARAVVGDDKLSVDVAGKTLSKQVAGLRVDLSAIAKGHGCDRVAAVLDRAGLTDYMVEIGGEVRVRGANPRGEPWKVGVERPTGDASGARVVEAMVRVRDVGVATSGDYRNYWERDGVRYSHTIDPRTGRPITHTLASVTVVDRESAAMADAWATALNVLGPERGYVRAVELDLAAYFLVRTEAGFEVRSTPAFAPYLSD